MADTKKTWTPNDETKKLEEKSNSYGEYKASDEVNGLLTTYNTYRDNNNPGEWTGGTYGQAKEDAYEAYKNRPKFSYDVNGDALYQQYKDKYINQGRLAMADTIGQASAMTGGYGSSYATTAGSQAYQSHLQNLNDIVPQLYQMAYDRYNQEGEDLKTQYSMLDNMYNTEYGEHRDKVSDYNTNLDRYYSQYTDARNFEYGSWDADRTYYQTAYQNAYNRDYGQYRDSVADEQWQASYNLQKESASKLEQTEEVIDGLTNEQSDTFRDLFESGEYAMLAKYILSLPKSEAAKAHLAEIWLPEQYRKAPEVPSTSWTPGKNSWFNTIN